MQKTRNFAKVINAKLFYAYRAHSLFGLTVDFVGFRFGFNNSSIKRGLRISSHFRGMQTAPNYGLFTLKQVQLNILLE